MAEQLHRERSGVTLLGELVNDPHDRCDAVAFPSPGPRDALRATPSLDSPIVYLPPGTAVTSAVTTFELDPRGSVFGVAADGTITPLAGDVVISVAVDGWTNTLRLNAVGRIRLD